MSRWFKALGVGALVACLAMAGLLLFTLDAERERDQVTRFGNLTMSQMAKIAIVDFWWLAYPLTAVICIGLTLIVAAFKKPRG